MILYFFLAEAVHARCYGSQQHPLSAPLPLSELSEAEHSVSVTQHPMQKVLI